MKDFKNYDTENETFENDANCNVEEEMNNSTEHNEYEWVKDEFEPAMHGTIQDEKNALAIYVPKPKKKSFFKSPVFAAIVSAVTTSAICFAIFAAAFSGFVNNGNTVKKPEGNILSVAGTPSDSSVKNAATTVNLNQMTIPDIYDKVSPAVVSIISTSASTGSYLQSSGASSSGSGVILTADGYIVTNNHVVDGASIITVKTTANQSFDAQIVGKDERTDLAVLKVSSEQELPFAELGDSSVLRVGDMALAIGNPLQEALASTLTVGYISAINRTMVIEDRQMTMLQTDAAINPGNSGGALINIYGQVIGINTAKSTGYDVEGLGFAIPINEAIPVVESIIENGYVKGRPLVGITGIDVTEQIAKANNLPIGVYVASVIDGGAAQLGGLQAGDVILKFDGKEVKSIDEINEIRDEHKVGDAVEVEISRNGTKKNLTIELQEEKPVDETETNNQQGNNNNNNNNNNNGYYNRFPSDFFSWFGW